MIKKHTHTHEGTSYASGTIILMITRYCIEAEEATLSRQTRRQPDGHTCDIKEGRHVPSSSLLEPV